MSLSPMTHQDESLCRQLETHLATLKRNGLIHAWHDRRIGGVGVAGVS